MKFGRGEVFKDGKTSQAPTPLAGVEPRFVASNLATNRGSTPASGVGAGFEAAFPLGTDPGPTPASGVGAQTPGAGAFS